MLLQGLNQHLLEGRDLLQISLNVTDINTAESAGEEETFIINSCMYLYNIGYHACGITHNPVCMWYAAFVRVTVHVCSSIRTDYIATYVLVCGSPYLSVGWSERRYEPRRLCSSLEYSLSASRMFWRTWQRHDPQTHTHRSEYLLQRVM